MLELTKLEDWGVADGGVVGALSGPTSVEAEEALVAKHLLGAVEAVLIHQLPDKGSSGPLVLHAGLHQVDGVHSRCSRGCGDTQTQTEHDPPPLRGTDAAAGLTG